MKERILHSHYISAVGGYLELVESPLRTSAAYCVRYNWDLQLSVEDDTARIMPFLATLKPDIAEIGYKAILLDPPSQQLDHALMMKEYLGATIADGDDLMRHRMRGLAEQFLENGFDVEIEDVYRTNAYNYDDLVLEELDYKVLSRHEALGYVREVCTEFGVYPPALYWGDDEIEGGLKAGLFETDILNIEDDIGEYIKDPPSILMKTPCFETLLHELAHHVEACATTPKLHQAHGNMFQRILLQILDTFTDLDSEEFFYEAQSRGLFRREVGYEDVMKPIGMLSRSPVLSDDYNGPGGL